MVEEINYKHNRSVLKFDLVVFYSPCGIPVKFETFISRNTPCLVYIDWSIF